MFCNNSPENFTNSGTVRNSGIRYKRKTEGISLIDQINGCDCAASITARIEEIKFGQDIQSYKTGSVNGVRNRIRLFTEGVQEILDGQ